MQNSITVSATENKNCSENSLQVVKNATILNRQFQIYGTFENPLFFAKDVAEMIDYSKTSKGAFDIFNMLKSIDEDEKLIRTIFVSGQNREMWFLTENGLYEVLMLSRKPIAKEFKKEVKKILHEIRTKGSFQVPKTFKEALLLAAAQQEKIEQQEQLLIEQKPKVEAFEKIANSKGLLSVEEVGKKLGFGKIRFYKKLREMQIFHYVTNGYGDKVNLPYQYYENKGYVQVKEEPYRYGDEIRSYTRIFFTGKGEAWITDKVISSGLFDDEGENL